jgi:hypothetical protein
VLGDDADRRSRLLGIKLGALVREHVGTEGEFTVGSWPPGAALLREREAWILVEDDPHRALGRALAWARQHDAARLHLLAERETGLLARRAGWFAQPPSVWHVEGRRLIEAVPEPFRARPEIDPELAAFRALIEEGGAEPVEEHGVLAGEVEGLEVCRAVRDRYTGVCRLEVGVGAHDREAFQMLHGDVPTATSLHRIVLTVAQYRAPGADPHPLNRLGAERAVRARVIRQPDLVGAAALAVAPPPVPRPNLKDPIPCVATGVDADGRPVVVVCSTGIDLDLVPFAADARAALGPADARLVIAVPARDAVPVTRALAAALAHPAEVVALAAASA